MRIGLDARLNAYRTGGISTYTHQLLNALARTAPDTALFALQHRRQPQPLVNAPNVYRATIFTPPHHRLEQWVFPLELCPLRLDILHCPDFIAPRYRPCRAVVTIHDLAFLRFPEILDRSARHYYNQVRTSTHYADAVIAVSQSTCNDICHFLDLPPERITVVHEAAAPLFAPLGIAPGTSRIIHQQRITAGTFLLFVSTLEPRKNLPMLLRALRLCCDRQPAVPYHLVIAGARGWHDRIIFETIRDLHLYGQITLLGMVGPEVLHWLYNACLVYVNPSLYEGFGLPVLEALACGAPTIVSNTSSLPEVAGDAALLLPPEDVEAWAETIADLWHNADQRALLSRRGSKQAARFSWERAARETLAVYQRVVGA